MNQDERDAVAAALTARQRDLQRESVDEFGQLIVPSRGTWPVVRGNRASTPLRGRLHDKNAAPEEGELTNDLAGTESFAVEQILSGRLAAPVAYRQDHDEWVIVIEGAAVLEVDGTEYALTGGDWFLLPANVHHRLVSTEPGTNWLAVRGTPPKPS